MYFRSKLDPVLISFATYTAGWVDGWLAGKLESNAKLNSKLKLKLKLKLELSLAIYRLVWNLLTYNHAKVTRLTTIYLTEQWVANILEKLFAQGYILGTRRISACKLHSFHLFVPLHNMGSGKGISRLFQKQIRKKITYILSSTVE